MPNTITNTDDTDGESVIAANNEPDYASVNLPTKSPTEYSYVERRGEILSLVEQAGHPRAINQSELAERYGVSQPTISKDLDRLDEYIRERISKRRDLKIESALDRSLRGLLDEGEYYQAAKVAKMLNEYLEGWIETLEFRWRLDRLEDYFGLTSPTVTIKRDIVDAAGNVVDTETLEFGHLGGSCR